jgi:Nitrile hydratase beta subunit, C-terminal
MDTKFKPGDKVRIRVSDPPHHFRTPRYIQGKTGTISCIHGAFRNPESLAYGGDGLPKQPLYLVCLAQRDVWGQHSTSPQDTLLIDIYEHWLEAIET